MDSINSLATQDLEQPVTMRVLTDGIHNGNKFSTVDLTDIVANFKPDKFLPQILVEHNSTDPQVLGTVSDLEVAEKDGKQWLVVKAKLNAKGKQNVQQKGIRYYSVGLRKTQDNSWGLTELSATTDPAVKHKDMTVTFSDKESIAIVKTENPDFLVHPNSQQKITTQANTELPMADPVQVQQAEEVLKLTAKVNAKNTEVEKLTADLKVVKETNLKLSAKNDELELVKKTSEFDALVAAGKANEQQKNAYMKGDIQAYIDAATPSVKTVNLSAKGDDGDVANLSPYAQAEKLAKEKGIDYTTVAGQLQAAKLLQEKQSK